jgi:hypothetical protein
VKGGTGDGGLMRRGLSMPERTKIVGWVSHDRVSSMSYYIIRSPSLLGDELLSLSLFWLL